MNICSSQRYACPSYTLQLRGLASLSSRSPVVKVYSVGKNRIADKRHTQAYLTSLCSAVKETQVYITWDKIPNRILRGVQVRASRLVDNIPAVWPRPTAV